MQGLTLQHLSERTKLSPRMLAHIEDGNFAALPAGLQGRAHIRNYALALGLDADEIVAAVGDRVPVEQDPLDALRARARQRFVADHPLAASVLTSASAATWRRAGAVAIDAALLAGGSALMFVVTAWLTSVDLESLWRHARWPLAVSSLLTMVLYVTVSHSLGGRSAGMAVADWLSRALVHRHPQPEARGHAN